MKFEIDGNTIVSLFESGEDPHSNFKIMAQRLDSNILILSGVGMIKDPIIGYFDGNKYHNKEFKGCWELISYNGNVTKSEDGFISHIHVSIAGEDHKIYGGHLSGGTVHLMNEVFAMKIDMDYEKNYNEEKNLKIWNL